METQIEAVTQNLRDDHKTPAINIILFYVLLFIAAVFSLIFSIPEYSRYQARATAANQVKLNEIKIRQQEQLIKVETQKAEIRVEEAKGIAHAQQIINATLTDRYLQHEAIKAQEKMASSPNHTQIYIPVGNNGIPVVKTVD
ncbi:hypothetical protein LNV08_01430 [Paucibacter sp. TC2R-5]|uniref:hypothetical protein n=1 Tax=Paucibacter sp. TC2R-5 TaxID=2893555 RepID=UPI0021E39F47|nr:hypothetical protein [Paucibacter sp. TC2R-5]MCV2357631.1 hypothetical protein [Paucibacter sp. TC2R-5]